MQKINYYRNELKEYNTYTLSLPHNGE